MTDRAVEAASDAILDVPWTFYPTGDYPNYTAMAHAAVDAVRPIIRQEIAQATPPDHEGSFTRLCVEAELVCYIQGRIDELQGSAGPSELLDLAEAIRERKYRNGQAES